MPDSTSLHEVTSIIRDCGTGQLVTAHMLISINDDTVTFTLVVNEQAERRILTYRPEECRAAREVLAQAGPSRQCR